MIKFVKVSMVLTYTLKIKVRHRANNASKALVRHHSSTKARPQAHQNMTQNHMRISVCGGVVGGDK